MKVIDTATLFCLTARNAASPGPFCMMTRSTGFASSAFHHHFGSIIYIAVNIGFTPDGGNIYLWPTDVYHI